MATITEKMAARWAEVFIGNSEEMAGAADVSWTAILNSFRKAFAAWQVAMFDEMQLTDDITKWPAGSPEEFLAYAKQNRDEIGFPPEVDFGERGIHAHVIDDRPETSGAE